MTRDLLISTLYNNYKSKLDHELELAQKNQKELLQRVRGKNIAQHGAAHINTEIRLEDVGDND